MKTNTTFFKVSHIKSKSVLLAFCMLPPVMFIYLFLISNTLQLKTNRRRILLSAFLCSLSLTIFTLGSFYVFDELNLERPLFQAQYIVVLSIILIPSLLLLIYSTMLSVNYERQFNSECSYQNTDFDYLYRFCVLLFLPFTIWHFHDVFLGYFNAREEMDE